MEINRNNITAESLRSWLEEGRQVVVLDVRPVEQRAEWSIPGSIHIDAYEKLKNKQTDALEGITLSKDIPIVAVCAAGKTSRIATELLQNEGYKAYSLEGGMKGWSLSWNTAELVDNGLTLIQIRRTGKGCLSYMLASQNEAIVIDASVDVEVYQNLAKHRKWNIKYVMDTHIHADHLSRSPELARVSGARLYLPDQDKVKFDFMKIHGGDVFQFGDQTLSAISTPGHTLDSMSFTLGNKYLFTGDTLFTEGVGRPDLKADVEQAKARASMLFSSLKKLTSLDSQFCVFPGHISKPVSFDKALISATLAEIQGQVTALSLSEEEFVENILARIPPVPSNYLQITEMNLSGNREGIDLQEVEAGANRCAVS